LQKYLKSLGHVGAFVVDGDETFATAAESNFYGIQKYVIYLIFLFVLLNFLTVVSVIPPVVHCSS
jgi:hypothetical protein